MRHILPLPILVLLLAHNLFSQNWSLNGNVGIGANQFLGTTDARDLRLRTNNQQRMVVTSSGRIGIGTNAPSYALHLLTSTELRAGYFSNTTNSVSNTFGLYAESANTTNNSVERAAHLYAQGANGYNYGLWSEARYGATNYGVYARGTSAVGTSAYGLYSQVSGAGANYAGYFTGGNVYMSHRLGINESAPTATFQVRGLGSDYPLQVRTNDNVTRLKVSPNGSVSIGTGIDAPNPNSLVVGNQVLINTSVGANGYLLCVNGKTICTELMVEVHNQWPDYVFKPGYPLPTLPELEQAIADQGHLPGLPSAAQVQEKGGIELGEMNRLLLEKIEQMTLYQISLEKRLAALEQLISKQNFTEKK